MDIEIRDTITLSDDKEYVVASKVSYKSNIYYYLIDSQKKDNVKFCVENPERHSLLDVIDKNLVQILLPMFIDATKDYLES